MSERQKVKDFPHRKTKKHNPQAVLKIFLHKKNLTLPRCIYCDLPSSAL